MDYDPELMSTHLTLSPNTPCSTLWLNNSDSLWMTSMWQCLMFHSDTEFSDIRSICLPWYCPGHIGQSQSLRKTRKGSHFSRKTLLLWVNLCQSKHLWSTEKSFINKNVFAMLLDIFHQLKMTESRTFKDHMNSISNTIWLFVQIYFAK